MTALFENRDANLPFDGDQLRELIERAAQVDALTQHEGWAFLHDYVIAMTAAEQRYILAGNCVSQEDYARRTGKVTGMLAVLEAPERLNESVRVEQARRAAQTEEEDE